MDVDSTNNLKDKIFSTIEKLGLLSLEKKRDKLKKQSEEGDFWKDNQKASKIMQDLTQIDEQILHWRSIEKEVIDLLELLKLGDKDLESDLDKQFIDIKKRYESMLVDLSFNGPYDNGNAIISIYAGAGGTDAQDWTFMLQRMYLRYCENSKLKTEIVDESHGEEAGIKSVTFRVKGQKSYGKLKGEQGVHRLVRLSPFNAKNLRQTSFARVDVLPEISQPEDAPIDEKELKIDVYRAGGRGGQSVNTTDSAVRITHIPTGIVVSIQNERSQIQNKETAMTIIRSKLAKMKLDQHKDKISDLKGPTEANEWGSQIRNYVLHPYNMVKDLRTNYETSNTQSVLDGEIDGFIKAFTEQKISV